jgi:hypothetical protein
LVLNQSKSRLNIQCYITLLGSQILASMRFRNNILGEFQLVIQINYVVWVSTTEWSSEMLRTTYPVSHTTTLESSEMSLWQLQNFQIYHHTVSKTCIFSGSNLSRHIYFTVFKKTHFTYMLLMKVTLCVIPVGAKLLLLT